MDGSVNRGQKREAELDAEDPGGHFTQRASHQKGLNRKADTSRDFPLAAAWMDLRDVRLKADKHLGDTVQARPEGKPPEGSQRWSEWTRGRSVRQSRSDFPTDSRTAWRGEQQGKGVKTLSSD